MGEGGVRGRWWVTGLMALALLGAAYVWASTPRFTDGGVSGVSSPDQPVFSYLERDGLDSFTTYVADIHATSATAVVGFVNDGLLPVTLLEVWPDDAPFCFQPTQRVIRTGNDVANPLVPGRPLAGTVVGRGELVSLWITGQFEADCVTFADPEFSGTSLLFVDDIDVVVSVAGRQSTVRIPLNYQFGWTDDPEVFTHDREDVRRLPPQSWDDT